MKETNFEPYIHFLIDFSIDLVAIYLFCFVIFFKRYHHKEALTAYALFNVFLFVVVTVLFKVDVGVEIGFGLFAILTSITLRSENLKKIDITYFFGSLTLAIINAVAIDDYFLIIICNIIVIFGAYFIDHPRILSGVREMKVTLDHINPLLFESPVQCIEALSYQFKVEVISYEVLRVDYVRDSVMVDITYKVPSNEIIKKSFF